MSYKIPLIYLHEKKYKLYNPFLDSEWELNKESLDLYINLVKGLVLENDLTQSEQQFVNSLKSEGLLVTSKKSVTWFLSLRCSLSCEHCYQNIIKQENVLSWEETRTIFDRLLEWGIHHLSLSGGDVFLSPHLFPLLKLIASDYPSLSVSLLTNGFILAKNKKAQQSLVSLGSWKPFVQLSLYSHEAKIHDVITGIPGSFEKTLESIQFLQEHQFPVLINCVLMKTNFDQRAEIIDFLENKLKIPRDNFNFDTLLFPYVGQTAKEVLSHSMTPSQFKTLLDEEDFSALPAKYLQTDLRCTGCQTKIAVTLSGDCYPCNMVQSNLGNLIETSVSDILKQSSSAKRFLTYQSDQCEKCPTKFCKKCQAFTKGVNFDKIYCVYTRIADQVVQKRISDCESKGYKRLII